MPKTSIELFALFNVSYCFFFCAAAAEASAIEEVGSGEIDLELGFFVSDLRSGLAKFGSRNSSMNSLSVYVHLSVTTCTAQRHQLLKPLKIEILVRKAREIFSIHACCTEVLFSLAHF